MYVLADELSITVVVGVSAKVCGRKKGKAKIAKKRVDTYLFMVVMFTPPFS